MDALPYLKRRFRALYPLTFLSAMLSVLVSIIDRLFWQGAIFNRAVDFYTIWLSATFTSKGWVETAFVNHAIWYMTVLWLCILLYYIVVRVSKESDNRYYALCVFFVILGWICIRKAVDIPFLTYYNGRGYLAFFMGALLWEYQTLHGRRERCLFSTSIAVVLMLLMVLSYIYGKWVVVGDIILAWSLFIAPGMLLVVPNVPPVSKLLSLKPFICLSKVSTCLFLFQGFAYDLVKMVDHGCHMNLDYTSLLCFIIIMGLVGLSALLAHVLFENRLIPYLLAELDALRARDIA